METQIIEKQGKKQFAVIPYKDFLRMQQELEDYHELLELRRAKADPRNQQGRAFHLVASELGLKKKKA
jgi:PHD/YefM family antitoxin component YafN of YafNO toxin-antitoxin module